MPLVPALRARGHDATRTPNNWIEEDASDEQQLLRATAQGRLLFTFNIGDVVMLASYFPAHGGIILAAQQRWTLQALIGALDRLLRETEASTWPGQVRWLNYWCL